MSANFQKLQALYRACQDKVDSRMAAVVLVSLPPPPLNHPAYFYMEYMDLLVENVPRMLSVRRYRRDVVRFFT